jgi:hypothetical protein
MARALIPNSRQIPDAIFDSWMAELSGAEFKELLGRLALEKPEVCHRCLGLPPLCNF